ncbi:MAG TPA: hypothetical protein VHC70_07945 [Phycisphaerales bacterium]|jgi:hypothetical protein|nr:hypothetical protein [Phycisphaerales bacterium]
MLHWKRTIRTPSSERFVALRGHRAVATADVHHLDDGRVVGMVVFDEGAGWSEEQIADLLAALNEDMLPGVGAAKGTLLLTGVVGRLVNHHAPEDEPGSRPGARVSRPGRVK